MISWLQTNAQRHYKWLFIFLLAIVIVAFVFTIGAAPGIGPGERGMQQRFVFGQPFTTEDQQRQFFNDAALSAYLQTGRDASGAQLQEFAFQRAAAIHLARQLGLPEPTGQQMTNFLRELGAFAGPDGQFDPQTYTRFIDELDANPQMNQSRVTRVVLEDFRARQAREAVGGPGYVMEAEVRTQVEMGATQWTLDVARLNIDTVAVEDQPAEEELRSFYEGNPIRYQIPERMAVRAIEFPLGQFAPETAPSDEELQVHFERNRSRFAPPPNFADPDAPPPPAPEFEDVRERVAADLAQTRARTQAIKVASDFAYTLFEESVAPGSERLTALVQRAGASIRSVPPFTAAQGPQGLVWPRQATVEAFRLSPGRPYSDPIQATERVMILVYQDRLEPQVPPFEEVRERVAADYREERRRELFVERGQEIRQALRQAMTGGASFVDAAQNLGLETSSWESFTRREPPENINWTVLSRIDQLPLGRPSEMIVMGNEGVIAHVRERRAPDAEASAGEYAQTMEQLQQITGIYRQRLVLDSMVERELRKAGLLNEN
jgi:peptidyl-prolyl cis-trans isomerase D